MAQIFFSFHAKRMTGLDEQDRLLEAEANEIIERTRREVARNPKDHVAVLLNQIATLSDINNERIAIIEKREEQSSGRNFIAVFLGLFALVFGYLSKTSDEGTTERAVFIVLTTIFGGLSGTLELITFRRQNPVEILLFFLFSASAVTIVLVVFLGLSEGNDSTRNIVAGIAGAIGVGSLFLANKRKRDREAAATRRRKQALGARLRAF